METNLLDKDLCRRAYYWSSMDPDKRADEEEAEAVRVLAEKKDWIDSITTNEAQRLEGKRQYLYFKEKLLAKKTELLHARSRTASSMVTGGANFPVEKNRRAMESHRNKTEDYLSWLEKVKKSIAKRIIQLETKEEAGKKEYDSLERQVLSIVATIKSIQEGTLHCHASLIKASFYGRISTVARDGNIEAVKKALDLLETEQAKLKRPIFTKKHKIWTLVDRVTKEITEAKTGSESLFKEKGFSAINNHDEERIQILFDGKPEENIRTLLKKNGYRWSPRHGTWQRKNTNNGLYNVEQIRKHLIENFDL